MRIAVGRISAGQVVVDEEGEPLPEGQRVTLVIEDGAGWTLDEASTRELIEAMAECDRGEVVSADAVFAALPPRRRSPPAVAHQSASTRVTPVRITADALPSQ